jgi:hypothetical protein
MAAPLGFKDFSTGDILTAADVDGYLMQGVWVFANAAARTSAVTSPEEGNMSFLKDTNSLEYYSGSAWVAVDTTATVPSQIAGKNKIINGDFFINQRNFTSTTSSGNYNFDRWIFYTNTGTGTLSTETFTLGTAPVTGYEGKNFARIVTSGQTGTGAYAYHQQRIESVRTFANQTVTVSFWAKATTGTPTIAASFAQSFGTGGSPSSAVLTSGTKNTLTTSWARYSATFAIPSISGKTIGTNNNDYLGLYLWVSAGTDFNAYTDSMGIQNNTFDIWGVQVEAGSVATPFTTATGSIQGELSACYRYYYSQTPDPSSSNYAALATATGYGTTIAVSHHPFPTTMRTNPTVSASAANTFYWYMGSSNITPSAVAINTATTQFGTVSWTISGGTNGLAGYITPINNKTSTISWSAEL